MHTIQENTHYDSRLEIIESNYFKLLEKQTPAEKALAEQLRKYHLIFYPQFYLEDSKGNGHFLDFFIPILNLAIEVDGGYHLDPIQKNKDIQRDHSIQRKGISTLRISNETALDAEKAEALCRELFKAANSQGKARLRNVFWLFDRRDESRNINMPGELKKAQLSDLFVKSPFLVVMPYAKLPKTVAKLLRNAPDEWIRVQYELQDKHTLKAISAGGPNYALTTKIYSEVREIYTPRRTFIAKSDIVVNNAASGA